MSNRMMIKLNIDQPLTLSLFALSLTFLSYALALGLARWCRFNPLVNPVVVAVALIIGVLLLFDVPYPHYFVGAQAIHFLLGPATVALAIPLAKQAHRLRTLWRPLLCSLKAVPTIFKPHSRSKFLYLSLLTLLFELLTKIRKEGLMSIESDIDNIYESAVFSKYPVVLQDPHLMEFICDYLRLMVSGNVDSQPLENLMDVELETHHTDENLPIQVISKMADSLPAFGIVAAVMGVVHTMESVGIPPGELGILIAKALVGTFLGILLSYGFVGPIAARLEQKLSINTMAYHCVKVTIIASLTGYSPPIAVEFGRKALSSRARPSFRELEEEIRHAKGR